MSSYTTIRLRDGDLGGETMRVRCNLAETSAPVQVDYCEGDGWEPTQYQCADCRHYVSGLIEIGQRLAAQAVEMPIDDFACEAEEEPATYTVADTNSNDAGLSYAEALDRIGEWYEDADEWADGCRRSDARLFPPRRVAGTNLTRYGDDAMMTTIRFESHKCELTTEHPASHYGAGVLLFDDGRALAPSQSALPPKNSRLYQYIATPPDFTAAQMLVGLASATLLSDAELMLARSYLSQHPDPKDDEILPIDERALREKQCRCEYSVIMGDTSQGVEDHYWREGWEELRRRLRAATNGRMDLVEDDSASGNRVVVLSSAQGQ